MSFIEERAKEKTRLQILEAGCGTWCHLDLKRIPHHLTGIDLDAEALEIRKKKYADIDDYIVGDLETVDVPAASFDVIYNSFVLEHIEHADVVLDNFARWLKPGGIIIIRVPDSRSVHGFCTKVTPHWFHVLYYRLALRQVNAGKPGYAPYPTYYHPAISRQGIRSFCQKEKLELQVERGDNYYRPGKGIAKQLIILFKTLMNLISFGRLSSQHTNLLFIIRKPV